MFLFPLCITRRNLIGGSAAFVATEGMAMGSSDTLGLKISLKGDWAGLEKQSKAVLNLVRSSCLSNVQIRSDRLPDSIIIENAVSPNPSIWLHKDPSTAAWIRLNAAPGAWCQLAYQFGHELGHVLVNSWTPDAKPQPPSQWIEEALAEAFSLFGLWRLAANWRKVPPFPNNQAYASEILRYLDEALANYAKLGDELGIKQTADWYAREEVRLEDDTGLYAREKAFSLVVYTAVCKNRLLIEDYPALNRWPERTRLPNKDYLSRWESSCKEVGTTGALPRLLANSLRL